MTALAKSRTEPPTAASILTLLAGIERHGEGSPGAIGFRSALHRAGREAHAAGGSEALDTLQRDVATADPGLAEPRAAILAAAWAGLMPGGRS